MNPLEIRDEFLIDARNDAMVALTLACYFIATILPHVSLGKIRAINQTSMKPKPKRQVQPL